MDHNVRIQSVLKDLDSQKKSNITATVKKWEIARKTFLDRFHNKNIIIQKVNSSIRQQLLETQKENLIKYINKINNYNLYLIS